MSICTDELVRRNATFAAGGAYQGLTVPANQTLRVHGCVDSRVDPSDVLGPEFGDAVVMRNVGGRSTSATWRSSALLGPLGQGQPPAGAHPDFFEIRVAGLVEVVVPPASE